MSKLFRTQLVLMIFGLWDFGEHVVDPRAFTLRLQRSVWRPPMVMCNACVKAHPRSSEIKVRCAGSLEAGQCDWCWNSNPDAHLLFDVLSNTVYIAWEGKTEHGPQIPGVAA